MNFQLQNSIMLHQLQQLLCNQMWFKKPDQTHGINAYELEPSDNYMESQHIQNTWEEQWSQYNPDRKCWEIFRDSDEKDNIFKDNSIIQPEKAQMIDHDSLPNDTKLQILDDTNENSNAILNQKQLAKPISNKLENPLSKIRYRPVRKIKQQTSITKAVFSQLKKILIKKNLIHMKKLDRFLKNIKCNATLALFEIILWFAEKISPGNLSATQQILSQRKLEVLNEGRKLYLLQPTRLQAFQEYAERIFQALGYPSPQERLNRLYNNHLGPRVLQKVEKIKQQLQIEIQKEQEWKRQNSDRK